MARRENTKKDKDTAKIKDLMDVMMDVTYAHRRVLIKSGPAVKTYSAFFTGKKFRGGGGFCQYPLTSTPFCSHRTSEKDNILVEAHAKRCRMILTFGMGSQDPRITGGLTTYVLSFQWSVISHPFLLISPPRCHVSVTVPHTPRVGKHGTVLPSIDCEIAVMEQVGNSVFTQAADFHTNDHVIGMKIGLTRRVIRAYLAMRMKTYAHGNIPSSRHEMTKLILFKCTLQ